MAETGRMARRKIDLTETRCYPRREVSEPSASGNAKAIKSILKPSCARIDAEEHPPGKFVVIRGEAYMLGRSVDIPKAPLDPITFVKSGTSCSIMRKINGTRACLPGVGAGESNQCPFFEGRLPTCVDLFPLFADRMEDKRTGGLNQ